VSTGPRVKFLVDAMERMGCKPQAGFYSSVDCEGAINGGFQVGDDGQPGVCVLCCCCCGGVEVGD
jgi:hypothetical protein